MNLKKERGGLADNMDQCKRFKEHIKDSVRRYTDIDKKGTIRLISHLDADGISASALMINLLNRDNRKYSVSIVQQLNRETIMALSKESYKSIIFTDLGSGQLEDIIEILKDKNIIILDHHETKDIKLPDNITHINPHLFGIDGSKEISGAGVVFLFVTAVNPDLAELSHIPIIGAIGDVQEDDGFSELNKEILKIAIDRGKIKVIKGLRFFGAQTRPLYKVLQYCTNPYIPGVSGSESGAIQFLNQIGISPKDSKGWRKLVHLSDEELKKLSTALVMQRLEEEDPQALIGDVYILPEEKKESPTRDAKEFSTLLNACGRLGKASLGIGACLGDKRIKEKAIRSLKDYKREIVTAIKWYEQNVDTPNVIKGSRFMILNTGDQILSTVVGTLASIIAKSKSLEDGTFILSLADTKKGLTKVSLRVSGNSDVDLFSIIKDISDQVEGAEAGGHMHAAGAMIPTAAEQEFIKVAKAVLEKKGMEERIV